MYPMYYETMRSSLKVPPAWISDRGWLVIPQQYVAGEKVVVNGVEYAPFVFRDKDGALTLAHADIHRDAVIVSTITPLDDRVVDLLRLLAAIATDGKMVVYAMSRSDGVTTVTRYNVAPKKDVRGEVVRTIPTAG